MRRRRRKSDSADPRQKALDLIELALDESTTEDERRSAAVKAVKFIDKYDLLRRPFEGNKTIQAAMNVADALADTGLVSDLKTLWGQAAEVRRRR